MRIFITCVIVLSTAVPVVADDVLTSPYRDQASSEIRGLTEKEILDLREGRGMGVARAAELNGYPGPRHVLDAMRDGRLHLSPDQGQAVQRLFDDMTHEAQRLGNQILAEESTLERRFREGTISERGLHAAAGRIAALQGELRAVHLRAHLETRSVLTAQQIEHYNQLRGYVGGSAPAHEPKERH